MVVGYNGFPGNVWRKITNNRTTEYSKNKYFFDGEIANNPYNGPYIKRVNSINVLYREEQIPMFREKSNENPGVLELKFSDEWLILEYLHQIEYENISLTSPTTTKKQVFKDYFVNRWNNKNRYNKAVNFLFSISALEETCNHSYKLNEEVIKLINYAEENMFGKQLKHLDFYFYHRMQDYIIIENHKIGKQNTPTNIVKRLQNGNENRVHKQIAIPSASKILKGVEKYKTHALAQCTVQPIAPDTPIPAG